MEEDVLIETVEGGIGVLTLNRPGSLNALNPHLMRQLVKGVRGMADDDDVRVVLVTGAGRAFCAGGDRTAIAAAAKPDEGQPRRRPATLESRVRWLRRSSEATRLLHEMGKPTIAMINGACAGAGLSIAAACDMRFAARSAIFNPAFTGIGMPGDYGGSWFWSHILGTAKARQLYLLGERRDAEAALAFGLVDQLFDDDRLHQETIAVAQRLVSLPPSGLSYAKANLNAALTGGLDAALDRESLNMMLGRQALVEARKTEAPGG